MHRGFRGLDCSSKRTSEFLYPLWFPIEAGLLGHDNAFQLKAGASDDGEVNRDQEGLGA